MYTYSCITSHSWQWLVRSDLRNFYQEEVLPHLDTILSENVVRTVTDSKVKKTVFLDIDSQLGVRKLICKRYFYPGLSRKLRYLVRRPKGIAELQIGRLLAQKGIETIQPECVGEMTYSGVPSMSMVFIPYIEGLVDLECVLRGEGMSQLTLRQRRSLLRELASVVQRIHRQGIYQYDFNLCNFLLQYPVADIPKVYFIDFGRVSVKSRLSTGKRMENLAKLNCFQSFLTRSERLFFLKAYEGRQGLDRCGLRKRIRKIDTWSEKIMARRKR